MGLLGLILVLYVFGAGHVTPWVLTLLFVTGVILIVAAVGWSVVLRRRGH
jgi:hypothetical protein